MENKSACFTGHRDIDPSLEPLIREKLRVVLINLIEEGYTHFYNGGARGFDLLAAEEVLKLKESYPYLCLHVIVPCAGHTKNWHQDDLSRFEKISAEAFEVKCLLPMYINGCMHIRNRYMVDNSELCIAFLQRESGGSAGTVKYAGGKEKRIINIFEEM